MKIFSSGCKFRAGGGFVNGKIILSKVIEEIL
jgi:hypothetical protein